MKKTVFSVLILTLLLALGACSRTTPPSVTPDATPSQSVSPGGDVLDKMEEGVGDLTDDIGQAAEDAARGIGDAVQGRKH